MKECKNTCIVIWTIKNRNFFSKNLSESLLYQQHTYRNGDHLLIIIIIELSIKYSYCLL